jgi:hypothetical protein
MYSTVPVPPRLTQLGIPQDDLWRGGGNLRQYLDDRQPIRLRLRCGGWWLPLFECIVLKQGRLHWSESIGILDTQIEWYIYMPWPDTAEVEVKSRQTSVAPFLEQT